MEIEADHSLHLFCCAGRMVPVNEVTFTFTTGFRNGWQFLGCCFYVFRASSKAQQRFRASSPPRLAASPLAGPMARASARVGRHPSLCESRLVALEGTHRSANLRVNRTQMHYISFFFASLDISLIPFPRVMHDSIITCIPNYDIGM